MSPMCRGIAWNPCEPHLKDLYHPDDLLGNPIVPQNLPEHVAIYGIKGLLKVDEDHAETSVPFLGLLHNDPQRYYLVAAGSLLAKSCLFDPEQLSSSSG